ncbi:MAG: Hsp20 family protein [Gammaproteobacteria bacterium]|nr:Hsp20 family protein [Gammaproteobacteria bacterium]MDH5777607.1 Hsp20 family protein [Gammaproteobacteria bacterium]
MRNLDLTPLYRSAVGFDRLASMFDEATRTDTGYPPYNIELVEEDQYRITMAVAGFAEDELEIEVEGDSLRVTGSKQKVEEPKQYLHQGIAARNFERRFNLADHVEVRGAKIENGLLHIELERVIPEAMKPRKIEIESKKRLFSGKAA